MIALGFQVHILSSMIPIFLMCIGTVSSIHILSEFFDVYTREKGRKETIREVMQTLFVPILYTSLTTAAGFASLTFTPIPPAQVFGAFLSVGVMIALAVYRCLCAGIYHDDPGGRAGKFQYVRPPEGRWELVDEDASGHGPFDLQPCRSASRGAGPAGPIDGRGKVVFQKGEGGRSPTGQKLEGVECW